MVVLRHSLAHPWGFGVFFCLVGVFLFVLWGFCLFEGVFCLVFSGFFCLFFSGFLCLVWGFFSCCFLWSLFGFVFCFGHWGSPRVPHQKVLQGGALSLPSLHLPYPFPQQPEGNSVATPAILHLLRVVHPKRFCFHERHRRRRRMKLIQSII